MAKPRAPAKQSGLKGRVYDDLPRPRVAYVGLEQAEVEELVEFLGGGAVIAESLGALPGMAAPSELDLIISADEHAREDHRDGYSTRHLILLGKRAWGITPGPTAASYYTAGLVARSNQYYVSETPSAMLQAAVTESLRARGVKGLPLILHARRPASSEQVIPDPAEESGGWLAWPEEPQAPLAVNFWRPIGKGLAWFPHGPTNRCALVRAICYEWAERVPETFPTIIPWAERPEWMTKEELVLSATKDAKLAEMEHARQTFEAQLTEIDAEFQDARVRGNNGARALLTSQDAVLVKAVRGVLEDLGFSVTETDEVRDPEVHKQKREDLLVRDSGKPPDWTALVEVKGKKKQGGTSEDLTKIERHVRTFLHEEKRLPSIKVYICNTEYERPPETRNRPYQSDPAVAKHFCDEDSVPGIIVPTPDLYRLHREREQIGLEKVRELLFGGRGVFRYP